MRASTRPTGPETAATAAAAAAPIEAVARVGAVGVVGRASPILCAASCEPPDEFSSKLRRISATLLFTVAFSALAYHMQIRIKL